MTILSAVNAGFEVGGGIGNKDVFEAGGGSGVVTGMCTNDVEDAAMAVVITSSCSTHRSPEALNPIMQ